MRGEIRAAKNIAERLLPVAEAEGRIAEVSAAHQTIGVACLLLGDLAESRSHLELALDSSKRERAGEASERVGLDAGVSSRAILAHATWHLGDLQRARRLIEEAIGLARELGHPPTTGMALWYKLLIEGARSDLERVLADAENLLRISQQHRMAFHAAIARVYLSWARGRLGDARNGAEELRHSLADYSSQGNRAATPAYLGLLAELEAAAGYPDLALTHINEGLVGAQEGGQLIADAFLYRLRGDILLKRNPADLAAAEDAYKTAIAIAKQQGARSWGLLAALSLAKLCQSTGRPADAHAVLAPALEGFSPTPEMPEIGEAQALLAALAETDEVKAAATSRNRMLQLQTRYGFALTWSLGIAAEETQAAAARTKQLAAEVTDPTARFTAYRGQFVTNLIGGHVGAAHSTAETYLAEAKKAGSLPDIASASMALGHIRMLQGALESARDNLKRGREIYDPGPKFEVPSGHSLDSWTYGTSILALVCWQLGEVESARQLIDEAKARAADSQHGMTLATAHSSAVVVEALRGDPEACIRDAETLAEIAGRASGPFGLGENLSRLGARSPRGPRIRPRRITPRPGEAC
jgi:tetratricopeptide (TPR) repeat protein